MATNHSPAQAVLESRLLQHVLRFDDVPNAGRASPGAVNARHAVGSAAAALQPRRPVFIVAAPRSGSTLLFETLAVSPQFCTVGGEAHWLVEQLPQLRPGAPGVDSNRLLAEHVTPEVTERVLATLWPRMVDAARRPLDPRAAAGLRWLEKTPKNSLRIPFLERLFPDASFVYLWRDPHENIASIIEAWRAGGWVTYPELDGWDGPWSMIVPPGYRSLRGRPLEDVAAFQWERTNATILDDLASRPRDRWVALSYAELLRDPEGALRGLCAFAGVEFDTALAARAAGPLPASRHTHTEPAPDKWRRHEAAILARRSRFEPTWQRLQALPTLSRRSGS
jgi:hypothetical protein